VLRSEFLGAGKRKLVKSLQELHGACQAVGMYVDSNPQKDAKKWETLEI